MDITAMLLGVMALSMVGVTLHAWRLGNEKRDLMLLGATGVLCGAGSAAAALI